MLFVADSANHLIRKVVVGADASTTVVSTYAGVAARGCGQMNGLRGAALLCFPTAPTLSEGNDLYFIHNSSTVRVIRANGCVLTDPPEQSALVNVAGMVQRANCTMDSNLNDIEHIQVASLLSMGSVLTGYSAQRQMLQLNSELAWRAALPDKYDARERLQRMAQQIFSIRKKRDTTKPMNRNAGACVRAIDGLKNTHNYSRCSISLRMRTTHITQLDGCVSGAGRVNNSYDLRGFSSVQDAYLRSDGTTHGSLYHPLASP